MLYILNNYKYGSQIIYITSLYIVSVMISLDIDRRINNKNNVRIHYPKLAKLGHMSYLLNKYLFSTKY